MLVLQVDTGNELRGGQKQLAAHLMHSQFTMHLALPAGAPAVDLYKDAGAHVHELELSAWPKGAQALRALVRSLNPDLIVAQTSHAHTHALYAAQGRPVVVHRRVDFTVGSGVLGRWKYAKPEMIIAVSDGVKAILESGGVPSEQIRVVHDGVAMRARPEVEDKRADFCRSLNIEVSDSLILAAGALVDHKAHWVLVEAASSVLASHPKAQIIIAGEGPNRDALQEQIAKAGLQDSVHLIGQHPDLWRVMHHCELFCHPSVEEGMGSVIVEAMLAQLPVVATIAGGIPEVVVDNSTGLLVPIGRTDLLASAIVRLLDDSALRRQFGEAGEARALARFGVPRMASDTDSVYLSVVEQAKS
jgi:glycosyltransferase involved in cell wall biosynthesis